MPELNLMIDHISLSVEDLKRAKDFYSKALAPLGIVVVGEVTAEQSGSVGFVGFGVGRKGSFWVAHHGRQTPTTHICFRAPSRAAVRDFHAAALLIARSRPRARRRLDHFAARIALDHGGGSSENWSVLVRRSPSLCTRGRDDRRRRLRSAAARATIGKRSSRARYFASRIAARTPASRMASD